ncbi:hypothetical protein ACIQW4_05655 [Streptomyces albogriseolus]|uniref:hypothetical protein n=1 Tax=Streptomyces albogriseolus TaxID=1887 RepID=UPI003817C7A1
MIRIEGSEGQYAAARAALDDHAQAAGWPPRTPVRVRFFQSDGCGLCASHAMVMSVDGRHVIALDVALGEPDVYDHTAQAIRDLVAQQTEATQ